MYFTISISRNIDLKKKVSLQRMIRSIGYSVNKYEDYDLFVCLFEPIVLCIIHWRKKIVVRADEGKSIKFEQQRRPRDKKEI